MFDLEKFVKSQAAEEREGLKNLIHSFVQKIEESKVLSQKVDILQSELRALKKSYSAPAVKSIRPRNL